ncbi:MAG: M3 family oligoendopeptidase [Flavobacteriia bacterium]|jgi:oligoendopeptidase F
MKIEKNRRSFVDQNLKIDAWEVIKPFFEDLLERTIASHDDFKKWLRDRSELDAVLEEDAAWRYIKMTIDTRDDNLTKAYTFFVTEIQPKLAPYEDKLNKKLVDSPYLVEFQNNEAYQIYFRSVQTALKLFREENISIEAELSEKSQLFGSISAAQSIEHNGEKLTMQKAASLLKENDEELRKSIFIKMAGRRSEDTKKLNELYTELILKRHQLALNAGFTNYRDYKFESMGRFDYTKEDCFAFHEAIKKQIVPLVKQIQLAKLNKLGKLKFKPWDLEVDPDGKAPLKPFDTGNQLLQGTVNMFQKIDSYFSDCLDTMNEMGHLDLDSKDGKAPGGYNYPLYEIGVPFIFMNSVGAQRDLVTMVHEGGHAVHSFLSRELELTGFKNLPSEVAELASMSMELLTMELWNEFYSNKDDFKRAKKEQLESILKILPWIAQIDEFQHWVYENPNHSHKERSKKWVELSKSYGTGLTDWTGFEDVQASSWQRQLHLFEVPFYYIEYGIAQLGALGVWKNSLNNKEMAIEHYKNALRLGYTRSIPEIYETAGIRFDFSENYLKELADFVRNELNKL